jgi:hypothetical protein
MAEKSLDDWIKILEDRAKPGDIGEYFHREQCAELLEFLNELKKRRNGGSKNSDAREDFMFIVYDELSDDADNNRANRIIDAADVYADSF